MVAPEPTPPQPTPPQSTPPQSTAEGHFGEGLAPPSPDGSQPVNSPTRLAAGFAAVLRGVGLDVSTAATIGFAQALEIVGITDRDQVRWAGLATLVRSPDDIALYERAFAVFWDRSVLPGADEEPPPLDITIAVDTGDENDDGPDGAEGSDEDVLELRFSATEVLRDKDFADYSDSELEEASEVMRSLRLSASPRRSQRLRPTRHGGDRHDLRRTVRAALRTGGEPVRLHRRRHGTRNRRLVLLLDVSGSMEPYARALIRFAHAAVAGRQQVEVFALGTRLTRITRELSSRDPDRALRRAAASVLDYGGGTRLGEGLRAFNDEWGQRGMARGSIVIVLSDGWDRGDPDILAEQMQRLGRVAHKVVWVNPLKATPGYAPLARGMKAALPYVDSFIEGHSLSALNALAKAVADEL